MTDQPSQSIPGVTAYINPSSVAEAAEFYKKAFAAEMPMPLMMADDGKRVMHCNLIINGGSLMMSDNFPEHGYPWKAPQGFTLHLQVAEPQAWFDRAAAAGCTVTMPMQKQFWGDRYGQLSDPFGIAWSIGGPDSE